MRRGTSGGFRHALPAFGLFCVALAACQGVLNPQPEDPGVSNSSQFGPNAKSAGGSLALGSGGGGPVFGSGQGGLPTGLTPPPRSSDAEAMHVHEAGEDKGLNDAGADAAADAAPDGADARD